MKVSIRAGATDRAHWTAASAASGLTRDAWASRALDRACGGRRPRLVVAARSLEAGEDEVVKVSASDEQLERWTSAAQTVGITLNAWAASVLRVAAGHTAQLIQLQRVAPPRK